MTRCVQVMQAMLVMFRRRFLRRISSPVLKQSVGPVERSPEHRLHHQHHQQIPGPCGCHRRLPGQE